MRGLRLLIAGWAKRATLGPRGERLAAKHLKRAGYRIRARNLRRRFGEIDLLAETPDRRTLVVVEVKSGAGDAVPPEHHVTPAKQRKLASLAASLLREPGLRHLPVRFDVVAVTFAPRRRPALRHHVGAFESPV